MAYTSLPGIHPQLQDGNLVVATQNNNPVVAILGTAAKGDSTTVYEVTRPADAVAEFGKQYGTLIKGFYEAYQGGARGFNLVRVGAKSATLSSVGTGLTIETMEKDDAAGDNYKLFFQDSDGRVRIWRVSDDFLVYDNYPSYPHGATDEGTISVTGTWTTGQGDIGTLSNPLPLSQCDGVSGASYTAGTDGIQLSRMELFEALYEGYIMLENEDIDVILPQDVYLDDLNVVDMTDAEVTTLNTSPPWDGAPTTYPTRGTDYDALGKVFVQEYQGKYYFWWDMDNDGLAEIYPSGTGSAGERTDAFGNDIYFGFHEANFAYQLANACYDQSEDEKSVIGCIGVKPPNSWTTKDIATWIGRLPTYTEDSNGNTVIASASVNGTGLMGNKWMAGRHSNSVSGLDGKIVDGIDGLAYGGFIATDSGWPDGTELTDDNDHLIDIGKYLNVVGAYGFFANPTQSTSYFGTCATYYGGFVTTLQPNSAPTNKQLDSVRVPFRIKNSKLDSLAGLRYVMVKDARKGTVIADAPTAARPDSDYQRLMTVRIVNAVIEGIREVADPFLGEATLSGVKIVGLETAIDDKLASFVPNSLERYQMNLSFTPSQKILGECTCNLVLVTVAELRRLYIEISLSAT